MAKDWLQDIKDGWWSVEQMQDTDEYRMSVADLYIKSLIDGIETCRKRLTEAQQTIRMAYSDLPDKKYDAEATLEGYMTRHNLEEW